MPEIVADPPTRCNLAASGIGIQESQELNPDPFLIKARDARGRFAKGSSGNPRGRPRGIPNPRRRLPDLSARPLSDHALSKLLNRKPYLLRPLVKQLLPPRRAAIDPVERFGIDLSSLHTPEDYRQVLTIVLAAIAHGEISPAEGARTALRARARLRFFAQQVRAQFRALSRPVTGGAQTRPRRRLRPAAHAR